MKHNIVIPQPLQLITITKRKCSDKVQPHIKCGTMYVVKSVEKLSDGTPVLLLADNRKDNTVRVNANRFEWQLADDRDLQIDLQDNRKNKELIDYFTFEEQTRIAFTPLVLAHLAITYGRRSREAAAKHKLSILRPLARKFDQLVKEYEQDISNTLTYDSRKKVEDSTDLFMRTFAHDFQLLWFSVNNEFKRVHPNFPFGDMRTDALCGAVMVDMLYQHTNNMDKMISKRLSRENNTIPNPKIAAIRHILMGYAGEADKFNFKENNVVLAKKVLLKRINEIQFELN